MFLAIIIIGLGAALVTSALKGISLLDVLAGNFGDTLNPAGGRGGTLNPNAGDPNQSPGSDAAQSGAVTGSPKNIIDTVVAPLARKHGMVTGRNAAMIAAANAAHGPTVNGTRSDHQGPGNLAWAADMSNGTSPTPEMDALARDLAAVFGLDWNGSGAVSGTYKGYRVQLIYRSNVGGNHFNHVHFGIRVA